MVGQVHRCAESASSVGMSSGVGSSFQLSAKAIVVPWGRRRATSAVWPAVDRVDGAEGAARLLVKLPTWEDYLGVAVDEIMGIGLASILVRRRVSGPLEESSRSCHPPPRARSRSASKRSTPNSNGDPVVRRRSRERLAASHREQWSAKS